MTKLRLLIVLAAVLPLFSCSSNPAQEDDASAEAEEVEGLFSAPADSRPGLEIPPDLLASSGEKVQANAAAAAGRERVLPEVIGAVIESDAERSWLEIDADAEVVWRKLTEFWAFQKIELVEYRPQSGLMETDWFAKKGNRANNKGFGSIAIELFDVLISKRTALDKFTLRLERDGAGGTRVFVTHRGREKIAKEAKSNRDSGEFEWVERTQDLEKVAQLLQTIVLLFGSNAAEPA